MGRASVVTNGMDAVASQYEALRDGYAIREQVPATYVVWKQDGTYYGDHCLGTGVDYSGTNAASVINSAISVLTSGRTWNETVLLKGNITLTDKILMDSYTTLEISNNLALADSSDISMIENSNISTRLDHVLITGQGTIDHNRANNTGTIYGINLFCRDSEISNLHFTNMVDYSIRIFRPNGGSAIRYNKIHNIKVWDSIGVFADGYDITYQVTETYVQDSIFHNQDHATMPSGSFVYAKRSPATFVYDNYFTAPLDHGVHLRGSYACDIIRNTFDSIKKDGILLDRGDGDVTYEKIMDNTFFGVGISAVDTYSAIKMGSYTPAVWGSGVRNQIDDNRFQMGGGGFAEYCIELDAGGTYCSIQKNNFANMGDQNANKKISLAVATGNIVRNNQYYITENSGTDTITNPATFQTVAHGLDVTPTVDDFTITLAENPTNAITALWVDTIGAANFNLNVEPAPGASDLDFGWKVVVL